MRFWVDLAVWITLELKEPRNLARWAVNLAIAGAFLLIGYLIFGGNSAELRYRLTVRVQVDDRVVEGSSVNLVYYQRETQLLGTNSHMLSAAGGEATVVHLGSRGHLFALIKRNEDRNDQSSPERALPIAFGISPYGNVDPKDFSTLRGLSGTRTLPPEIMPLLVRFQDINDPASVQRVDPADLAASFGPGVRLLDISMTIVGDRTPLTTGIIRLLPWLSRYQNRQLDGRTGWWLYAENKFANTLTSIHFSTALPRP
jgi:hypothetical protein